MKAAENIPMLSGAQLVAHCAAIADALDLGLIAEAHDLLDTAEHCVALGAKRPPLLQLLRGLMLPAKGGYVTHAGDACPVAADVLVAVDLGDGLPLVDRAGDLCWGPGAGPAGEGRIHRWAPVPCT